jgi:glucose dehydrogenase
MTNSANPDVPKVVEYPILLLAWVFILVGLLLLAGGIWLISLGGTWYYTIAGIGLLVTGASLTRRLMAAVYVYGVVWLGTVIWAFWEVGLDGWAQVPRLVAPTVLLILLLITMPALRYQRRG